MLALDLIEHLQVSTSTRSATISASTRKRVDNDTSADFAGRSDCTTIRHSLRFP